MQTDGGSRAGDRPAHDRRAHQGAGASARAAYRAARSARRRWRAAWWAAAAALAGAGVEAGRSVPSGRSWAVLAALVASAGAALVGASGRRDPERWQRGAAGEVATAALLERLPARRWAVFHDLAVPGSRANVDHLVVGPTGVWLVDSKTTRARAATRLGRVRVGGRPLAGTPAAWEAEVMADRLGVDVRPVIALHGGGLRRRGGRADGVEVVPAEHLLRRLRRGARIPGRARRRALGRREVSELAEAVGERLAPRRPGPRSAAGAGPGAGRPGGGSVRR